MSLKLYGFNNLTKSLNFNIYDICYAKSRREQTDYIAYINEQYNSERLTGILFSRDSIPLCLSMNTRKAEYVIPMAMVIISMPGS